jgi:hypothetical protein
LVVIGSVHSDWNSARSAFVITPPLAVTFATIASAIEPR